MFAASVERRFLNRARWERGEREQAIALAKRTKRFLDAADSGARSTSKTGCLMSASIMIRE
jgi:hypothetical protein